MLAGRKDASASTPSSYQSPRNSLNIYAGETILRYLRGRQYSAPVLIAARKSIMKTSYVLDYARAGSTRHFDVFKDFIRPLIADRSGDEEWWLDFNVQPRARTKPRLLWVRGSGFEFSSYIWAEPADCCCRLIRRGSRRDEMNSRELMFLSFPSEF